MKRTLVATGLFAVLAVAGCGQSAPADASAEADAATAATVEVPVVETASVAGGAGAATPAAPGAPAFAVVYPGGQVTAPATVAQGPAGPGGILVFTTEATPDAVVAFYRAQAGSAGLQPITAMNQGEARAFSAGDGAGGRGQLMSVVATPVEGGPTSVQLDWTAGR
ncbi:hypothetical protein [Brevundimonas sp.]|uniref:hypothetical protein n=1 Tax=Brevundimonas sp. TaxID=1871086 RepID=UPI0035690F2C